MRASGTVEWRFRAQRRSQSLTIVCDTVVMSITAEEERARAERPLRTPRPRTVLMCRPLRFDVVNRINPWMNPGLPRALRFARRLREHGYEPIGVDLSELLLGGRVKCCTLELRR